MEEDALVTRANEERERLFQRYEHGREPGAEIDPWEDPGFEVYHQTDRYGFIHDKRLPQKIDPNEAKLRSIELERVKKWLKMLRNWSSKETQEKLHKRIYKGIPDKLRSQVWLKMLNVEKTMTEKKDVYQNMLRLARQWSTEARQIDSDVNRQFREHLFYRERYSIKQRSLFNVLTAYSMYNMEVGYCQGMSGVAGVLLMYMDEEEAFWALSTLLADKKFAMHGLYIEGFPKLNRLVQHHDRIIEKFMPKLKKHFDSHNLDSMIYSLKWFFVIFIERIPFNLCLRVWDIFLHDGERVIIAMAYTILRLHQKKLIKLKDMDLLIQYLQTKLYKDFGYDDDFVIKALEQSMEELKRAKLDLASPPTDIEFPKRPFGVFVEPTNEKKIGRRKNSFSETEKDVTEKVILRRDKTQELADSTISDGGLGGSNSQLNTGNIPESEDGCSLLGSSRKSLADTSVTSTADLSVFSIGQRSQQYDICVDDMASVHSDAEGESSPGSAFGSLSIIGRTPSAMMITPTPRAISPQDIVRIYVPPPPPEELEKQMKGSHVTAATVTKSPSPNKSQQNSVAKKTTPVPLKNIVDDSTTTNTLSSTSVGSLENEDGESSGERAGSGSGGTGAGSGGSNRNSIVSGDVTPVRRSFIYKSEEELTYNGRRSSSSSRRGSLTRKSPSLVTNSYSVMECEHLKNKRRSINGSDDQINRVRTSASSENLRRTKIMTSFEELARLQKEKQQKYGYNHDNRMTRSAYCDTATTTSDDEDYSPKSKYVYDSSIQYRKLATSPSSIDIEFLQQATHDHRSNALHKKSDNSDEYSSSSPNIKSVLTTPVNEQNLTMIIMSGSQSKQKLLTSGETTPVLPSSSSSSSTSHKTLVKRISQSTVAIGSGSGSKASATPTVTAAAVTNTTMTISDRRDSKTGKSTNRYSAPTPIESDDSIVYDYEHSIKKNFSDLTDSNSSSVRDNDDGQFRPRLYSNDRDNYHQYVQYTADFSIKSTSQQRQRQPQQQHSSSITELMTTTALMSPIARQNQTFFDNFSISHSHSSSNGASNGSLNRISGIGGGGSITTIGSDFDRRIATAIGGPYDYKSHSSHNNNSKETNKIRIQVNQNK